MCERNRDKMSMTAGTGDIACPFFNAHNRDKIRCMDIIPGTAYITTQFDGENEKRFHQLTYCECNFKMCWLYKTAMKMRWDE